MGNRELIERAERCVAKTYNRFPIALVRGEGGRVWDADGKAYWDFVCGLAVNNLGHCHPAVVAALREQAGRLLHVSNLYHIEPQVELAELLCRHTFAQKVFFCNSGTEANEAAIKLARKYSYARYGEGRHEILTMENGFHGRTMGSLAATAQTKFHKGFAPLLPGFRYVPFGDLKAAGAAVNERTCAILVEPLQGEGGVNVPSPDYLPGLRALCDGRDLLLLFDEVQSGMGRTGKLFAYEHFGVAPDAMALAKGLAGGTAIGALCMSEKAMAFAPGDHAATFGGNPLATAAGVAALRATLEAGLLEGAAEMGRYFIGRLRELQAKHPPIREVRGLGLLLGCELDRPGGAVVSTLMERGFLINCTMDTVLRFLPPLAVGREEVDALLAALDEVLGDLPVGDLPVRNLPA
ncbi:MAG: aspartate aminotransferase family protein, partial [Nitrospinota bacterium]